MLKLIKKFVGKPFDSSKSNSPEAKIRAEGLTYLDENALRDLAEQVKKVESEKRKGILIEAGCARGGSAIVMAKAKEKSRKFYVYDVFGMIPPPSEADGEDVHKRYEVIKSGQSKGLKGTKYYGYEENLFESVKENFARYEIPVAENNVHLVKGLFEDVLQIAEPVALAHLDGDWYESVMVCLQLITPNLVKDGVLVIDDYDAWSGCRKAVDEYFADKRENYEFVRQSRLHIIRR